MLLNGYRLLISATDLFVVYKIIKKSSFLKN